MKELSDSKTPLPWWLWLILVKLVVIFVLVPPDWVQWVRQTEMAMMNTSFGNEMSEWIADTGHAWYSGHWRSTGIEDGARRIFVATEAEKSSSRGMEKLGSELWFPWAEGRFAVIFGVIEQAYIRAAQFLAWAPMVPLILIPAAFDGHMMWRRRQYSFEYASPLVHGSAFRGAIYIVTAFPFLMLIPLPMPPVLVPGAIALFSVLVSVAICHTQKRV